MHTHCRICGRYCDGDLCWSPACERAARDEEEWHDAHRCAGSDDGEPHPCRCAGGEDACTRCASCHEQAEQDAEDARAAIA
jgi:hypothetical protein